MKSNDVLSPEAKAVAAAWFGMMPIGRGSHLRFGMVESRPTAKAQAALDELVAAGFISRMVERRGAVVYRPLKDCHPFLVQIMRAQTEGGGAAIPSQMKFLFTEPIPAQPKRDLGVGR